MINQTHFTLTTSACRNGKSGGGDKNQLGNCSVCVCVLRGAVRGRAGVVTSKLRSHIIRGNMSLYNLFFFFH